MYVCVNFGDSVQFGGISMQTFRLDSRRFDSVRRKEVTQMRNDAWRWASHCRIALKHKLNHRMEFINIYTYSYIYIYIYIYTHRAAFILLVLYVFFSSKNAVSYGLVSVYVCDIAIVIMFFSKM